MKKIAIGISAAALALAGAVYAQSGPAPMDPMGDKTVTHSEADAKAAEMFDTLDANHDGKLDKADREAKTMDKFKELDSDKNGAISPAEFAAAHERGAGHEGMKGRGRGDHPMMAMMMMRMADTNHDNVITRDEFMAAERAHFDKVDTNHDGKITPEERRAAMKMMREHMRQRMQGMRGQHMGHHMDGMDDGMGDGPPPPPPAGH